VYSFVVWRWDVACCGAVCSVQCVGVTVDAKVETHLFVIVRQRERVTLCRDPCSAQVK
jgi:hypothetical protein